MDRYKVNASALEGAKEMGFTEMAQILDVIMALTPVDFYKSMTSHANHKEWQTCTGL